jgi:hypothetical protein
MGLPLQRLKLHLEILHLREVELSNGGSCLSINLSLRFINQISINQQNQI